MGLFKWGRFFPHKGNGQAAALNCPISINKHYPFRKTMRKDLNGLAYLLRKKYFDFTVCSRNLAFGGKKDNSYIITQMKYKQ